MIRGYTIKRWVIDERLKNLKRRVGVWMKIIRMLERRFESNRWRKYAIFFCEGCGKEVRKRYHDGIRHKTCGCRPKMDRDDKLYAVWVSMKQRCVNKKHKSYKNYGGRGVYFCEEWKDWKNFESWALINGYKHGLTIDRKDNNGGYTPNNCRWIKHVDNARNSRTTKLNRYKVAYIRSLHALGFCNTIELSNIFNISRSQIYHILLRLCWNDEPDGLYPKI